MKSHALILAFVVAACSTKNDKPPAEPDQKESRAPDTCQTDVSALRLWLTTLAKEGGRVQPGRVSDTDVDLVVSNAALAEHSEPAVAVSLNPSMVMVEGAPVSEEPGEKLTQFLRAVKVEFEKRGGGTNKTLNVFVDSMTSWDRLVATTEACSAAGYTTLRFAFREPDPKPTLSAPPASSMNKEIMAFVAKMEEVPNPAAKQPPLSEPGLSAGPGLLQRASANCPQLAAVFANSADASPDKRMAQFTDGVADAIQACGCTVDLPALKEIYWHTMSMGASPPIKFASIGLAPTGVTLAASAEATWQEVHANILELASGDQPPNIVLKVE